MAVSQSIIDREEYRDGRIDASSGELKPYPRTLWYDIGWDIGNLIRELAQVAKKPEVRKPERPEDV